MMASLRDLQPDVVMLMAARDVMDRQWDPDEGPIPISDPRLRARQVDDYRAVTGWILGTGVPRVVWIQSPPARPVDGLDQEVVDPARFMELHEAIAEVVGSYDAGQVATVDLATWYAAAGFDDKSAQPDGIHFSLPAAVEMAGRLVGPAFVNYAVG